MCQKHGLLNQSISLNTYGSDSGLNEMDDSMNASVLPYLHADAVTNLNIDIGSQSKKFPMDLP